MDDSSNKKNIPKHNIGKRVNKGDEIMSTIVLKKSNMFQNASKDTRDIDLELQQLDNMFMSFNSFAKKHGINKEYSDKIIKEDRQER